MEALGYEYKSPYSRYQDNDTQIYYAYYENDESIEIIHGYDLSFRTSTNSEFECTECAKIENKNYSIHAKKKNYGIELQINEVIIPLKIIDFVNKNSTFGVNQNSKKVVQLVETTQYKILIIYLNVNGNVEKGKKTIDNYQVKIMVDIK